MSTLETNLIQPSTGTTLTVGASGDTIDIPSGATFDVTGATVTGLSAGITMAEQWRLATTLSCSSTNTNVDVTANLEKVDTNSPGTIGSSMSESSGIFTFPSTGIYLILSNYLFYSGSATSQYSGLLTRATTDNSSYSYATENYVGIVSNYNNGSSSFIFDVTDTSTHKIKFTYFTQAAVDLRGNTSNNTTSFSFIRLGDT
tara:strand:- start:639 stop:1241 length:603 start_codon:yes stop_codon:yes gene_type:complete